MLEPRDLIVVHGVGKGDLILGAVLVLGKERNLGALSELGNTENVNKVIGANLVVVSGVGELEGEHTLLAQVGLVDTSERTGNDGATTRKTGLKSGVLTRRTLTVVLVTNDDPGLSLLTVRDGSGGNGSPLAEKTFWTSLALPLAALMAPIKQLFEMFSR